MFKRMKSLVDLDGFTFPRNISQSRQTSQYPISRSSSKKLAPLRLKNRIHHNLQSESPSKKSPDNPSSIPKKSPLPKRLKRILKQQKKDFDYLKPMSKPLCTEQGLINRGSINFLLALGYRKPLPVVQRNSNRCNTLDIEDKIQQLLHAYQEYNRSKLTKEERRKFQRGLPQECLKLKRLLNQPLDHIQERSRQLFCNMQLMKWANYLRVEMLNEAKIAYETKKPFEILSDRGKLKRFQIPASKASYTYMRPTTNLQAKVQEIEEQFGTLKINRENIWKSRYINQLKQIIQGKN